MKKENGKRTEKVKVTLKLVLGIIVLLSFVFTGCVVKKEAAVETQVKAKSYIVLKNVIEGKVHTVEASTVLVLTETGEFELPVLNDIVEFSGDPSEVKGVLIEEGNEARETQSNAEEVRDCSNVLLYCISSERSTDSTSTLSEIQPRDLTTGIYGSKGSCRYYQIYVNSNCSQLVIKTYGGAGDVDLYVKRNQQVSVSNYDIRSWLIGNTETIIINNPSSGTYYICLYGYRDYSGVTLEKSTTSTDPNYQSISKNVTKTGLSCSAGNALYYYTDLSVSEYGVLEISTFNGTGDADLYVKKGNKPTLNNYDYRSYHAGNNETITYSTATPGTYYILVHAYGTNFTGLSLQLKFGSAINPPTKPVLKSPANGTTNASLKQTLTWQSSNGATSYAVHLGTNPSPSSVAVGEFVGSLSYTFGGTLASNTTYYWYVEAINSKGSTKSDTWSFTTNTTNLPSKPTLKSPTNGSTSISTKPTLQWNAASGATSYDLYLGTSSGPSKYAGNISATSYTVSSALTAGKKYYWYVVAKNSSGSSQKSDTWSFTTALTPPDKPVLKSPTNGNTNTVAKPTLKWNAANGATTYDLYLGTGTNPSIYASSVSGTSYSISNALTAGQKYYWYVIAKNGSGSSAKSDTWNFTIEIPQYKVRVQSDPSSRGSVKLNSSDWKSSVSLEVNYGTSVTVGAKVNTGYVFIGWYDGDTCVAALDTYTFPVTANITLKARFMRYRALAIGIDDYDSNSGCTDLPQLKNDVQDLQTVLNKFKNPYTTTVKTGRTTETQIYSLIKGFESDSQPWDIFVFYCSAHGNYTSQSYIVMSDKGQLLVSELKNKLKKINGTKIVLIDACLSGGFATLSEGRALSEEEIVREHELYTQDIMAVFDEPESIDGERGTYKTPYEFYAMSSSSRTQLSGCNVVLNNSFFTFFFLDGLGGVSQAKASQGAYDGTFDADGYGSGNSRNGALTFCEAFLYAKDKVHNYTSGSQTVQANHGDSGFIFANYAQ